MSDTRQAIAQFGKGADYWYYDAWMGLAPNFVDTWYAAECSNEGGGSVTGPHRATPEEAEADIERLMAGMGTLVSPLLAPREAYTSARVVKFEPALKISIAKEVI